MKPFSYSALLLGVCLLTACGPSSPEEEYLEAVADARTASERHNELFLNLELGMPRQAFFDTCTVLNQQKLITMGRGGTTVDYRLTNGELPRPARLTFAPTFTEERPGQVAVMNVIYIYEDWAPWNPNASADSLLIHVRDYYTEQYGDQPWYNFDHPQVGPVYTQIIGNRRTAFWKHSDNAQVRGRITDLTLLPDDPLGPTASF